MSSTTTGSPGNSPTTDWFRSAAEVQTYKNILYLLTAFPLGLLYFTLTVIGVSLGAGLAVLGVGIVILFATVVGVRTMAVFERALANTLLDTDIDTPDDIDAGNGLLETAKAYLLAESTLRAFGYVFAKFGLGIASFIALVTLLGTGLELLLLPVFPEGALNVQVFGLRPAQLFQTSTQRLLAVALGTVLLVVSAPVLNALARVNAAVISGMLGAE
ncbi:sensor domain-containing protein [Halovenus halobia]|uniref:sensor domain-containing protein n=1 Tax=Halovenus halobia TaxID=3396622 RepID=UPI003F560009